MQKRLCGREQEFGRWISPIPDQMSEFDLKDWHSGIFSSLIGVISRSNVAIPILTEGKATMTWLANGSKIYIDMGNFEVATAECLSGSLDIVTQEKASEQILNESLKKTARNYGLKKFALYKNNVGLGDVADGQIFIPANKGRLDLETEVTYGSHHNYSYETANRRSIFPILGNFIPAALILSGNGHISKLRRGKAVYCLSQRAPHISCSELELNDNAPSRPLIDVRNDEILKNSNCLNRLHVMSRDATRCELQTWLVDSATHLVLRLGEEGWVLPGRFWLKSPINELHNLNLCPSLDYKMRAKGNSVNLIQYNKIFLKAAKQLTPLSANEKKCLEEWERVLELLEAKAFHKLVGELDWVTKWYLIKSAMKKNKFGLDDARAWRIDWDYHNISSDPRKSLYAALEERGRIKHLVSSEDVKKAITTPPETRAKVRGKFIKFCCAEKSLSKKIEVLDWNKATLDYEGGIDIFFNKEGDPLSPTTSTFKFLRKLVLKKSKALRK